MWRILILKNKLGLFEQPFRGLTEPNTGEVLTDEAKEVATKLVEKSCVLLKNEAVLPLKKAKNQRIAVIGLYAESHFTLGFWASVSGRSSDVLTLKAGLLEQFGQDQLLFSRGFNLYEEYSSFGPLKAGFEQLNGPIEDEEFLLEQSLEQAKKADVILLTIGENFLESGEGASKTNLRLPKKQIRLIKKLAELKKPIVGLLYTGRPLVLTEVESYLNSLVASPISIIIIMELLAVLWFFGIHNAVLQGPLGAISMTMIVGNMTAFQSGEKLPYLIPSVIYMGMYAAGFMGFVTFFMIRCQSAKMKQLGKLSFIPSLFNITEPLMFGMPIILNPIFFIPQVFTQLIAGFVTWGLTTTILPISLNPTMSLLPWTTPTFIKMPFAGGLNYTILMVICLAIGVIMWYPFIKIADKKEYELERALEEKKQEEVETLQTAAITENNEIQA
ncbi:glycoside hydrolase family 3 C-terminal domain-containing protein [Enterococcus sp. AZ191]|uniref:glycoside hydrolase family 3 C-terminal domain-containing protein n=1 Tax=Enterococcus sp. AZ191 TaxID=2774639 RepID=UPI003F68844A